MWIAVTCAQQLVSGITELLGDPRPTLTSREAGEVFFFPPLVFLPSPFWCISPHLVYNCLGWPKVRIASGPKARVYEPFVFVRWWLIRKYKPFAKKTPLRKGLIAIYICISNRAAWSWNSHHKNWPARGLRISTRYQSADRPAMRTTTRGLTLYATRYLHCHCRRTSRKPRSRRSELEKSDSHAFLF